MTSTERVRRAFEQALDARHSGELERAKDLCLDALRLLADSESGLRTVVHGELGYICSLRSEFRDAVGHYSTAVQLTPTSELASLGLFHALVDLGERELALKEIVRFVTLRDSSEYRELLSHGFGNDLPPRERALADEARRRLSRFQ